MLPSKGLQRLQISGEWLSLTERIMLALPDGELPNVSQGDAGSWRH